MLRQPVLVYEADAGGRPVAIREREKLEGAFATLEEVAAVADKLRAMGYIVWGVAYRWSSVTGGDNRGVPLTTLVRDLGLPGGSRA